MGTETWIISLPLSDSILYLKIIHPPNFREEPKKIDFDIVSFPKWNVFKNKSGKFKLFHSERTCPHPVESP